MNKRITAVFSVLYLLILTWIILFKANPGTFHILFDETFRSVSFVPAFNAEETVLNAAVFAPLGIFIFLLFRRIVFFRQTALIALISLFYEALQYILCIGTADITDLISNTSGGAIGLFFCMIVSRQFGVKANRILSTLACAGTAMLFLLTRLAL